MHGRAFLLPYIWPFCVFGITTASIVFSLLTASICPNYSLFLVKLKKCLHLSFISEYIREKRLENAFLIR